MRRIGELNDTLIRAVILAAGLLGAAVLLLGCQGGQPGAGSGASTASGDCAAMQTRLKGLHSQGKSGSEEYKSLLNSYLAKGCQR